MAPAKAGLSEQTSIRSIEATTLLCMFVGLGVHAAIDRSRLNAKRQRAIIEVYFEKLIR